jgi:hypothetical protein
MGGIIPSLRPGYRITPDRFKWVVLIAIIGSLVLYFVFHEAMREVDEMYDKSGFIPRNTNTPPASRLK